MKTNPNRFWVIVLLLGWIFDFLFWDKPLGINFVIFVMLCLLTGILLLQADGLRLARGSGLLLLPIAFLAAVTRKAQLASGVLILPQRQTGLVAKQAAEVDVLSGGRLRLGIGVGWNHVE